ncbi:hypothetical protein BJY00DRAFT_319565 [Aspergillus carlsbadensis]|nr:hypothetical protein BJY00DRAFT_319565 [Aspergillus carlsbadensis]
MAEKPSIEHTDEVHPKDAGYFVGMFLASGLSVTGGLCAFGLIAPILNVVNEHLGPSASH